MLALLAFAFAAHAAPVSQSDAKLAAKAWVAREGMLGARMGKNVEKITTVATTNGAAFYVVKLAGAGSLFMSTDTAYTPVIAFTSDTNDFSAIDRKSPLWALLNRDVSRLASATRLVASAKASAGFSAMMSSMEKKSSSLWNELVAEGGKVEAVVDPLLKYANPITSGSLGDLRVPALMKTKWSQSTSRGKACWNYYTPNGTDPSAFRIGDAGNAVCGCVATAMAQIMRYHSYPTQTLPELTRMCSWNGEPMELTTRGGTYDWDLMTYDPDKSADMKDENYRAIGKLASDAGISVNMMYTSDESGAYSADIPYAMINYWGYRNAVFLFLVQESSYYVPEEDIPEVSRKALYSNFDAGLPVFMGIPGHEIVADGYGWNNGYEYVHLNMGWAGQCDYWYNLPEMTAAHPMFTAVDDLVYNVMPHNGASSAVVSGRVLDDDGAPLENAVVSLYRSGTGLLVTQAVSSARGVWGAIVEAGVYDVRAVSADGFLSCEGSAINVKKPDITVIQGAMAENVPAVMSVDGLGNSWGNDLVLGNPAVRVGSAIYTTLDSALVAAKEMTDPVIEIIAPAKLKKAATIDFNCTITATNLADAAATPVLRDEGATLTIAGGARVLFENVVFSETDDAPVTVLAGGTAAVSGVVGISEIVTADAGGFELAGALESAIVVDCAAAKDANKVFGSFSAPDGARSSASKIFNKYDDELGGVAQGSSLVWGAVVVDDASAIVKLVQDGATSNYRSLKTLMKFVTNDAEIVVVKDCSLDESMTVTKNVFFHSENGATITVAEGAAISVSADMVVSNITFDCGSKELPASFISVNEAARLTLGGGACLCNGEISDSVAAGAVLVNRGGVLTMQDGSRISGFASASGRGGAVSLIGTFYFSGGTISDCTAQSGGAVYAISGSKVYLSGTAKTLNNTDTEGNDDNIYLWGDQILELEEDCADVSVAVSMRAADANNAEAKFGTAAGEDRKISGIVCDVNDDVAAEIVGGELRWYEKPVYVEPVAKIGEDFYASLYDALADAEDGDSIEILDHIEYGEDMAIDKQITIFSADKNEGSLRRVGNCSLNVVEGGSLTVTNLTVDGGMGTVKSENKPIVYVQGGELVLESDSVIGWAEDEGNSAAGVVVYNGRFTMKKGSIIQLCSNLLSISGGGVHVSGERAEFRFEGGTITNCGATFGGGVALMGKAKMFTRGDGKIVGNVGGNLYISNNAKLSLDADFDGKIVVTNGFNASTKEFGVVADDYSGEDMTASAAHFWNEAGSDDLGVVVTNEAKKILVWASALVDAGDGTMVYETQDGETLALYGEMPSPEEPEPPAPPPEEPVLPLEIAIKSLTYDSTLGSWTLTVTNAVKSCWYTLFGGTSPDEDAFVEIETKRAEEDGEIVFTHKPGEPSYFWGVVAEPSDAYEEEE